MVTIAFEEGEINILEMSLQHCMETCKHGGRTSGCTDCEQVEKILDKIKNHR